MKLKEINYKEIEERKKYLDWFMNPMLAKLLENSDKGIWLNLSDELLLFKLKEEITELQLALISGLHKEIIRECADIANYAMFIASKYK